MEREAPIVDFRVIRAMRSLAYNRELKPVIEGRIERAEAKVRGYLMVEGLSSKQLGPFQVEMDEDGEIAIERLVSDEWEQMSLPQVTDSPDRADIARPRPAAEKEADHATIPRPVPAVVHMR